MILTYEQADRFYTLINALLGYANERFEVVRELPLPIVDLESQSKAALVAETLWDSVGIIDDFVRENPFDLPKRFLDTALAWKDALTGSFVFMGHEGGRALLMGDEDVFAVAGIQLEPSELLDEWPDVVRATLLPFDDLIVSRRTLRHVGRGALRAEGGHPAGTCPGPRAGRHARGVPGAAHEGGTRRHRPGARP